MLVCGEVATKRLQWSEENVELAHAAIDDENLSLRQAASMYGIPKSTLALYKSGKSQIGTKPGHSLSFGWIANHFAKKVLVWPVLLLVDGRSSHIDLHISKFCRDNGIYLYCLPPHTSHALQPLDVSFFKPLKPVWSKVCNEYRSSNPGKVITKYVFAEVFREA